MRCTRVFLLPAFVLAVVISPDLSHAQNSGYAVTERNGIHVITSTQPVDVEVYGLGLNDAYSYFGGVVK